jgi:hypothetical protein
MTDNGLDIGPRKQAVGWLGRMVAKGMVRVQGSRTMLHRVI